MYRVLIVDDEPAVCEGLCQLVDWSSYGFGTIVTAHNGRQALELHHSHAFDLIVTDLKMPILDGLGLIRTLFQEGDPCTIMILSAYGEFTYAQEAMRYGVRYYVLKPIEETVFSSYLSKIAEDLQANAQRLPTQDADLFERQLRVSSVGVIAEVVQYVGDHYSQVVTVEQLARQYNMSATYLGRLFKREMGKSFNSYLNDFRIRMAMRYLRYSQATNAEIGLMVGYQDANYFYKCFKAVTGQTPNAFRQAVKEKTTTQKENEP